MEEDWSIDDYRRQTAYWLEVAPPPNIGIMLAASALGVKFDHRRQDPMRELKAPAGISIAELAALVAAPVAGGDTSRASIEALRIIGQKGGPDAGE